MNEQLDRKVGGHTLAEIIAEINSKQVPPELLGEMMELHAALLPGDSDEELRAFEQRSDAVLARYGRSGDLSFGAAVNLRRLALGMLLEQRKIEGWTYPGPRSDVERIHVDLLRAAAEEPVIMGENGRLTFDNDSFWSRVLAITPARGGA